MGEEFYLTEVKKEYAVYVSECNRAVRKAMATLTNLKEAMDQGYTDERTPFDSIDWRIKSFESVVEKCHRKGYELNIDSIKDKIHDIGGIRIITPFRDDIEKVEKLIRNCPEITIKKRKDYVSAPKDNGYSSLHLDAEVSVLIPEVGYVSIPLEIQIRDKAMDMWATVEHIVKYKGDTSPEAETRFKQIADILMQFDEVAMQLRDDLKKNPAN